MFHLTVTVSEITTLNHKLLDDSVESRALVSKTLLASGKSTKVLRGLGDSLSVQSNNNPAERFIPMRDVKVNLTTTPSACYRSRGQIPSTLPCG